MTEKRFVYYEHKGADYILDTPNTELDFIEMLGDALEPEEIVEKLNELSEENKQLREELKHHEETIQCYRIQVRGLYKDIAKIKKMVIWND